MHPDFQRHIRNWSRRDFLKTVAPATLGAMLATPRALAQPAAKTAVASADRVILLWMAGGMAHTETFDPKRYIPYETGLEAKRIACTFPSIDTSADTIKISQGLENLARVMDRATLVRSFKFHQRADDTKLHEPYQYHWHTGYAPPQSVAAPHMGAFVAKTLGPVNPDAPAFVAIGQSLSGVQDNAVLRSFYSAGFLGAEFGPMMIPDPQDAARIVRPPKDLLPARFENRQKLFQKLAAASPVGEIGSDYQKQSMEKALDDAYRLMRSPVAEAFDLSREPKEVYDAYNTGRFGLGCLLARRLVEAGSRFVEVTSEYVAFKNWDTHISGHEGTIPMKALIDRPTARLIEDLDERGLLERTLVVIASEFSREVLIYVPGENLQFNEMPSPERLENVTQYGLHRHSARAGTVTLFGGGMKRGHIYGATDPEPPCGIVEKPVTIEHMHATIYHALGIAPNHGYEVEARPFYVTKDGAGRPIKDLFA